MQGGGHDLAWYESLTEEGNRELGLDKETLGCHVGPYSGLNIVNPQPNFEYSWSNNDPRDVLRAQAQGGQVVQGEDEEYAAYRDLDDSINSSIDSTNLYGDCILIRTPIEKVRERRNAEKQRAEASIHGGMDSYTDGASLEEAEYGRRVGGPTRFARRDHMVEYEEEGRTTAMWSPESGIVRR